MSKHWYNPFNWQWLCIWIHWIQSMDIMYPAISHWYYTECYKSVGFCHKNLDTLDTVGMVIDCQTIDSKKIWPVSHWYYYLFKKVLLSGMLWHPDCITYRHGCHTPCMTKPWNSGGVAGACQRRVNCNNLKTFKPEWTGTNSWQGRPNWLCRHQKKGEIPWHKGSLLTVCQAGFLKRSHSYDRHKHNRKGRK